MKLPVWIVLSYFYTGCLAGEQLFEINEISISQLDNRETNSSARTGKKLLKKLHSGAAFLAGIKLGSYLSNKGHLLPSLGQGSLATSNNFQLFGKTISSALSLSYGDIIQPLPLHDPVDTDENNTNTSLTRSGMQHVIVTVLENPTVKDFDRLKSIARITEGAYSRNTSVNDEPSQIKPSNNLKQLVKSHNQLVNQFNKSTGQNSNTTRHRINNRF